MGCEKSNWFDRSRRWNFIKISLTLAFFFPSLLGECINSSPAGKRRIAAEKQLSQLADDGNLFNVDAALIDGGSLTANDAGSAMDQIKSPVTFAAAIAICSVAIIIFVTIFTALQVSVFFSIHVCVYDTAMQ